MKHSKEKYTREIYDPELEWLVHETITTYWKYIDNKESLLTQEGGGSTKQRLSIPKLPIISSD